MSMHRFDVPSVNIWTKPESYDRLRHALKWAIVPLLQREPPRLVEQAAAAAVHQLQNANPVRMIVDILCSKLYFNVNVFLGSDSEQPATAVAAAEQTAAAVEPNSVPSDIPASSSSSSSSSTAVNDADSKPNDEKKND